MWSAFHSRSLAAISGAPASGFGLHSASPQRFRHPFIISIANNFAEMRPGGRKGLQGSAQHPDAVSSRPIKRRLIDQVVGHWYDLIHDLRCITHPQSVFRIRIRIKVKVHRRCCVPRLRK
ncbi:hypothetical protein BOTBODRAFT_308334 [Botryobasidium botryosum FD-172 SS1]|uniref:Uncharacterized protein n=1 Tax=Botryobasidium botryosum (strain FD-172 SS1) TaxID=930990 RepID=A0A067N9L9_BOTB1|nr:hypothetical protein BOTBODRAFT_308334 [Botryobasidium botryosum FD-172 SS1]